LKSVRVVIVSPAPFDFGPFRFSSLTFNTTPAFIIVTPPALDFIAPRAVDINHPARRCREISSATIWEDHDRSSARCRRWSTGAPSAGSAATLRENACVYSGN
jgi:hypothetical protein